MVVSAAELKSSFEMMREKQNSNCNLQQLYGLHGFRGVPGMSNDHNPTTESSKFARIKPGVGISKTPQAHRKWPLPPVPVRVPAVVPVPALPALSAIGPASVTDTVDVTTNSQGVSNSNSNCDCDATKSRRDFRNDWSQLLGEYKTLEMQNSTLKIENDQFKLALKQMEENVRQFKDKVGDPNTCRTILIVLQMAICMAFVIIFVLLALHHLYLVN